MNGRDKCTPQHVPWIWSGQHCRRAIGEQYKREPTKNVADELIRAPNLQAEDGAGDHHDDQRWRDWNEQAYRRCHAADVRGCLDRVADENTDQRRPQDPARIIFLDDVKQTLASDLPELRRQVDHREHHRKSNGRGPQQRGPELRSRARICPDGGTIVVGGAGHNAESERARPTASSGFVCEWARWPGRALSFCRHQSAASIAGTWL